MLRRSWCNHLFVVCVLTAGVAVKAQTYTGSATRPGARPDAAARTTAPSAAATTSPASATAFKPEEVEQLVASIALYPDSLLAQVLMASTYPLEVVQAEREVKANPSLKDSADALNTKTWDPSVKSLVNFPQVLTMMSEKLDWTVKLGDAFIADQKAVMDAVQRLRNKAYAKGNLKSNEQQKVSVQPTTAPAAAGSSSSQVIVVESSSPSVVYVPTYNPSVVYGSWPYPSYPPYYYYPPGYAAGTALISFGVGVACGAAWGHAWGDCDWHGGDVDVDIDKNVNFNGNIDREKFKAERDARQTDRQGNRDTRQTNRQQGGGRTFQHDPSHRQGVSYRDAQTTERFRGAGSGQSAAQARQAYRGRTDMGRQDLSRGGADSFRSSSPGGRTQSPGFQGSGISTGSSRQYSGSRSSSFGGGDYSGSSARAASNRGQYSRSSSSYSGRSGSYSGGSRSSYSGGSRSYGGSRGGGGGMRGGGGRGGRR